MVIWIELRLGFAETWRLNCWPSLNGDSMIKHRDLIPAESQKCPEVVANLLLKHFFHAEIP